MYGYVTHVKEEIKYTKILNINVQYTLFPSI